MNRRSEPDDYPIVAHADAGAPECCGCLVPRFRDDVADLTCNECGAVVRTVPAEQASDVLMEMAFAAAKPEDDHDGLLDGIADRIRPLPAPPRCRGIPIGDGHYTGCAYGYGDVPPFTGPCDCPVCNGSGIEGAFQPN